MVFPRPFFPCRWGFFWSRNPLEFFFCSRLPLFFICTKTVVWIEARRPPSRSICLCLSLMPYTNYYLGSPCRDVSTDSLSFFLPYLILGSFNFAAPFWSLKTYSLPLFIIPCYNFRSAACPPSSIRIRVNVLSHRGLLVSSPPGTVLSFFPSFGVFLPD